MKIKKNNLKLGNIKNEMTKRFEENQIASQSYQAGEKIPENTRIDLTISEGLINSENYSTNSFFVNMEFNGFEEQLVKIIVDDVNGKDVVYSKKHNPGDKISVPINTVGKTEVKVYYDDKLKFSKTIGG